MKKYQLAQVIEIDDYYQVEGIIDNKMERLFNSYQYLGLNNITANIIKEEMENGNIIRIVKEYQGDEVYPCDLIIIKENEMKNEKNGLEFTKNLYIQKARRLVNFEQAIVSGIQMFDFININNVLNAKGYFIYDDNKEEIYLKILETGDEELIEQLERYLEARDKLERASFVENEYLKLYRGFKEAESEKEIIKLYDEFAELIKPQYSIQ